MSPPLSLLETVWQRWKENRRIVLVVSGGYRSDTYIDSCVAYSLTSLIYCIYYYFNLFLLTNTPLQKFVFCASVSFVVRPKHPDFIRETNRHKEEMDDGSRRDR